MKFHLLFTILVIASVRIQKADSCTTVNDGCYAVYVCISSSCEQCSSSSECISQHTIRTNCSYEIGDGLEGSFCVQCSSDSQCGPGESCVTSSVTYMCGSNCTSPTSNCGPSSQCINLGSQFYCLTCENNVDCQNWSGNSASQCSSGVCSPAFLSCGQNSDCTNPASAYCSNSVCTACSSSSQCNHLTGTQICNSGTCVQCTSNSNCTDPTPYCSASNTCTSTSNSSAINTIQTSMSYVTTASVIVLQFANSATQTLSEAASAATTPVTSGVSPYNLFSYIALIKFASLFVLVNIPYRQRILDFFSAILSNNNFPNIFSKIPGETSKNYFLTGVFSRITLQSQFLLNYGSYMTEILLYLLIALLFHMVTHIFRKNPKLSNVLGKVTTGFYSAVVINTIGSQIPFIIGAIVSFEYGDGESSISDNLGLVMLILMVCVWLVLFSYFAILLFKSEVLIEEAERDNMDDSSPQNPGVSLNKMLAKGLLLPFISNRLGRQLALPLNLIKIMSIGMFIVMSQSYPLLQMIPGIVLQLGWLILDACSDSKKSKVDFVLNLLENFLLLMGFIACLLIALLENVEAFDYVLIGVIGTALILRTIYMIIGLIGTVVLSVCKKKKPGQKSSLTRNVSLAKDKVYQISLSQKNDHDQASMSDSFSPSSIKIVEPKINNRIELVNQQEEQKNELIKLPPRIQERSFQRRY